MPKKPTTTPVAAVKKILLVDDHPMILQGLRQCLLKEAGLGVCGQAGNAAEALRLVGSLQPDLVLVDIGLPGRDGLDLVLDIRARANACGILIFSMFDENLYAESALRAGAQGYVMKHEPPLKLIQAIRKVLNGEFVIGAGVLQRILRGTVEHQKPSSVATPVSLLSMRQLQIFRLIGAGLARADIARQLQLSVKTFEAHRGRILQKLGLKNAAELFIVACRFVHDVRHPRAGTPPSKPSEFAELPRDPARRQG
jgi:DNA-binding NarL/FixJ family response regulator